jgi:hypothetical protein
MAKTMQGGAGAPFNYMLMAFEESAKHRFEFNFVKVALAAKNAYVVVYGVRISDPQDYTGNAKIYLDQHSGEVGHALANVVLTDIGTLPHKEF